MNNQYVETIEERLQSVIAEIAEHERALTGLREKRDLLQALVSAERGEARAPEGGRVVATTPQSLNGRAGLHHRSSVGRSRRAEVWAYTFGGRRTAVSTWKELLISLATRLYEAHPGTFSSVVERVQGRQPYFSQSERDLRFPAPVRDSGMYVETNMSADAVRKVSARLVQAFGYPPESLSIDWQ